ncbi:hypothetical protein SELMODRAFT_403940 [Selaginella moellendorffii]|uniref:Uncharacterized protein n=2 Tax=Selaginella moellendorffii TaxID=88036 RepID=D8QT20_SELML|nr:hypothetical protein SELMODRAFT_403940 [Selaginella moellendorffii]
MAVQRCGDDAPQLLWILSGMGLCVSKSSARSTPGSEKSEKCRWDKHGNVFFPVRRASYTEDEDGFRKHQARAFMNPVYTECESPGQTKRGFSSISKLLRGSKVPPLQLRRHPLSPSRTRCRDLLGAKAITSGIHDLQGGEQPKRTLLKFMEADKSGVLSLSRSSSAKEGSLTRSSSAKEAALSRCSSQKEGKRDLAGDSVRPSPDHLATIACLKVANFKFNDGHAADRKDDEETQQATEISGEKVEAAATKSLAEAAPLTRGLGLPCYQTLVFRAVSPDKSRGRCTSSHSSLSSEELAAVTNRQRRRSPSRKSPGRRSPRKGSPNKRTGSSNFVLNASAARFQKSLPGARTETAKPPQVPKDVTAKAQGRSALRELPLNSLKPQHCRRHSSPVKTFTSGNFHHPTAPAMKLVPVSTNSVLKSEKFSVFSDAIHLDIQSSSSVTTEDSAGVNPSCLSKEPRSGSKRLRSPKRFTAAQENLNFRLSVPGALEDKFLGATDEHTKDKHVDIASTDTNVEDKQVLHEQEGQDAGSCSPDPELLELLERTPKKLKKMALKLALMIELDQSSGEEDDEVKQDVDLELKLGMAADKSKRSNRDGIKLDLSVALDSPTRTGSTSVPATPRQSISSTCNGLSVEARIGSSKHSEFSFHIMKNPDELFGKVPRFHISRTQQREESTSSFHLDTSSNKVAVDLTASQEQNCDRCTHSSNEDRGSSKNAAAPVQRCSSFGFENDDHEKAAAESVIIEEDKERTPGKRRDFKDLDLNRDAWLEDDHPSPGFEFQVKSAGLKSLPATPVMPTAPKVPETDALSLSADEIAEIWGAFEAGQEEIST